MNTESLNRVSVEAREARSEHSATTGNLFCDSVLEIGRVRACDAEGAGDLGVEVFQGLRQRGPPLDLLGDQYAKLYANSA
mgnify:CR=1 FL=1